MKGPHGYGRYNDDPEYVGCPRAKTDMTPLLLGHSSIATTIGIYAHLDVEDARADLALLEA